MDLSTLIIGNDYERPALAKMWGYESFHAIGRGVVTPRGKNIIILFVTAQNQPALPQYNNQFDGEILSMDGEEGHGTDQRLAKSSDRDQVLLFYRDQSHFPFRYCGEVKLLNAFLHEGVLPSRFVFLVRSSSIGEADDATASVLETPGDDQNSAEAEGRKLLRLHIVYERSRRNRSLALKIHGHICKVCDFDFDATYGADLAHQYIEIHHTRSITELHGQVIDPAVDLAPMCANCHRMAHRRTVAIVSIEELQNRVRHYRRTSAL